MLENRSFDHMLGFLNTQPPTIEGLTGNEWNPQNFDNWPNVPPADRVDVNRDASYEDFKEYDPDHSFEGTAIQVSGPHLVPATDKNMGFVFSYNRKIQKEGGNPHLGRQIMQCFSPQRLPVLTQLAQEFAVCDHWFSSVPGPTWPNRFFVHAATSDGKVTNDATHLYDMRTIYQNLAAAGKSWKIYYHDIAQAFALTKLIPDWDDKFKRISTFFNDVESGNLPNYSFIEPRYHTLLSWKANDQHPGNDAKWGEFLIADIYEAIRKNETLWKKTLLVILYDEHGGFYDHVPPPIDGENGITVVNPDGKKSSDPEFAFNRLGMRVPALLVSPYIEKRHVDKTVYDHASVPATIKKIFNLPSFLTKRDENANTFDHNLTLDALRSDTPETLSRPGAPAEAENHLRLARSEVTPEAVREGMALEQMSDRPIFSNLHFMLFTLLSPFVFRDWRFENLVEESLKKLFELVEGGSGELIRPFRETEQK
jgi:phospholipase C